MKTKWMLLLSIGPWLFYLLFYQMTRPADPADSDKELPLATYSLAVGCNSISSDQAGKETCAEFNKALIDLYNGNGLLNSSGLSWTVSLMIRPNGKGALVGLAVIGSFPGLEEEDDGDSTQINFPTNKNVAACMAKAAIEMMENLVTGPVPDDRRQAVLRLPKGAAAPLLFFGTILAPFERAFRRVENLSG